MLNKIAVTPEEAVEAAADGMTIMVGGFGGAGSPETLLAALTSKRLKDLTIVANNAGAGELGLTPLVASGAVRKVICSFPKFSDPFEERYRKGEIELELVPQGTLSERIRAGGAGIGAFYTPTGVGTILTEGKEQRTLGGREHVLEFALKADLALIRAWVADRSGNLVYNKSARNYNPAMVTAARLTVVEVNSLVEIGSLDPEAIITPGLFVDRMIVVGS